MVDNPTPMAQHRAHPPFSTLRRQRDGLIRAVGSLAAAVLMASCATPPTSTADVSPESATTPSASPTSGVVVLQGSALAKPSRDRLNTDPETVTIARLSGTAAEARLQITAVTSAGASDQVTASCSIPCFIPGPSAGTGVSVWPSAATWHSVSSPTSSGGFATGTDAVLPGTGLTVVSQAFTPDAPDLDRLVLLYRDAAGVWDQHHAPVAFDDETGPGVTVLASDDLGVIGAIHGTTSLVTTNQVGGLSITDRRGTQNTVTLIALPKGASDPRFKFAPRVTSTAGGLAQLRGYSGRPLAIVRGRDPQGKGLLLAYRYTQADGQVMQITYR